MYNKRLLYSVYINANHVLSTQQNANKVDILTRSSQYFTKRCLQYLGMEKSMKATAVIVTGIMGSF